MKYAIEKGIARGVIPRAKKYSFPLKEMEVGDSFFVPDADIKSVQAMRSALYQSVNQLNWKLKEAGLLKPD